MYERNQFIVFQVIFYDIFKFQIFLLKIKINQEFWFKLSQTHDSTDSFAYFKTFFLKTPILEKKKKPSFGSNLSSQEGELPLHILKLYIILLLLL